RPDLPSGGPKRPGNSSRQRIQSDEQALVHHEEEKPIVEAKVARRKGVVQPPGLVVLEKTRRGRPERDRFRPEVFSVALGQGERHELLRIGSQGEMSEAP